MIVPPSPDEFFVHAYFGPSRIGGSSLPETERPAHVSAIVVCLKLGLIYLTTQKKPTIA